MGMEQTFEGHEMAKPFVSVSEPCPCGCDFRDGGHGHGYISGLTSDNKGFIIWVDDKEAFERLKQVMTEHGVI